MKATYVFLIGIIPLQRNFNTNAIFSLVVKWKIVIQMGFALVNIFSQTQTDHLRSQTHVLHEYARHAKQCARPRLRKTIHVNDAPKYQH